MKITSKILALAFVLFTGTMALAQSAEDEKFFLGKWKLMVFGLPNGDTPMTLKLEKKDGNLGGTIGDGNSADIKLTKAEINKGVLEVTFIGQGYSVPLYLEKKEEGKVEGSMNDMFDITGSKVKE